MPNLHDPMESIIVMNRSSTKTLFDVTFGVVVMGTVGVLIGTILGGSSVPIAAGLGLMLGAVVGFLGGASLPREYLDGHGPGRLAGMAGCRV